MALERLTVENISRDLARRVRCWHARTKSLAEVELRRRYLSSRALFYQRQEIIQTWHMAASANRYCRRMSLLSALRQFNRRSRERYHKRRCRHNIRLRVRKSWYHPGLGHWPPCHLQGVTRGCPHCVRGVMTRMSEPPNFYRVLLRLISMRQTKSHIPLHP